LYQIDNKKPISTIAHNDKSESGKSAFFENAQRIIRAFKGAKKITMRFEIYSKGDQDFEFDINDFDMEKIK